MTEADVVRVGVIGCGWAGTLHALAYQDNPGAELVGLVDRDPRVAERLAARVGAPVYSDMESLFGACAALDAVSVCTPSTAHFEVASRCLEQSVHVLCEKPLTRNVAEAETLVETARRRGLELCVNYNQRFSAAVRRAKRVLRGQTVHYAMAGMFQHGPKAPTAVSDEFFLVTDAACHLLDTLRYLNGDIAELYAIGAHVQSAILSDLMVTLGFHNGSVGFLSSTFAGGLLDSQHPFQRVEIVTEESRLVVDNMIDSLSVYPNAEEWRLVWSPSVFEPRDYTASVFASVNAWVDRLARARGACARVDAADTADPVSGEDGLAVVRLCDAIIRSLRAGTPQRL